jgi:hypothetical protein
MLAEIQLQKKIALAIASSGIAATLFDGGRTAHSAFTLPLNNHKKPNPMCGIKKSGMAEVLHERKIFYKTITHLQRRKLPLFCLINSIWKYYRHIL